MRYLFLCTLILTLAACNQGGPAAPQAPTASAADDSAAIDSIQLEDLKADIAVLASDEFEGRAPSSPGEEKTVHFLAEEFKKLGLQPGAGDSFFQDVPLVASKITNSPDLSVSGKGEPMSFQYGPDVMVWTKQVADQTKIENSDMVFVGYGVVAPEYGWNDYEGLDVKGKTVVIVVNDPGYATKDEKLFNGFAMTYYGRWTYKFEEAARQGAAGALIIHEDGAAGYPWAVVEGSWSSTQFDLVAENKNMDRAAVEGWISNDTARKIFAAAGHDLDAMIQAASTREFKAVDLGLKASMTLENKTELSTSRNVIAVWPGETKPDEYVFYTAHWDHLGKDESLEGDQIFNGAVDNASGTAALIEIAEAFTKLEKRQDRSIVLLAVTAEEKGLLGSRYYAENPIFPTRNTVAAINMDALSVVGKTKDVEVVGFGASELEDILKEVAATQGRHLVPDSNAEKGYFYRSDHLNFAKVGVPALYAESGKHHHEHGEEFGAERAKEYTSKHYHKPSDEINDSWDLSGAIQDLQMLFMVGRKLSYENQWPNWYEGNEFKATRDKDRAGH